MKVMFNFIAGCFLATGLYAQGLPAQIQFSADGKILQTGKQAPGGFYDSATIRNVYLEFPQSNYWTLLTNNYQSKTDIPATMIIDGITYDSVGVRFKGQTSYFANNTQKKSFNITLGGVHEGQDIDGFKTLNFNNAFQDASYLREVFYQHQIRRHIPAAKSNFIHLYLNGQDWGLYPNVQQLNKDFYKEWFYNNDGISWRADTPDGTTGVPGGPGGPGGGGSWGDGTAALNYLGADTAAYQPYYTLKSSGLEHPWNYLIDAAYALNSTPAAQLETVLPDYIDIDRTLWHLASEIAFTDDDSYVYKGKMDYYLYYDAETGLIIPIEYDGNSAMETQFATSWSPFYNANKVNYPLLNKVLAVPHWRQRYLAHLRTIINEEMNPATCAAMLDNYKTMIDGMVSTDPKKIYSYGQFNSEVTVLKNFFTSRKNYLMNNSEVSQPAPVIQDVKLFVNGGQNWEKPTSGETATVTANITFVTGLSAVKLYYSNQLTGKFTTVEMFDDGAHNDGAAGDNVFGGAIPAHNTGEWVRFYIEATAANPALSVSYLPTGAEHDVYAYQVAAGLAAGPVVINEIMAQNNSTVTDPQGTYEDWIELYNNSTETVDLSGYFLSDNPANLSKFELVQGTSIAPHGYLIFWADEDGVDGPDHCNFKLSASGEILFLLNPGLQIVDSLSFGQQQADMGLARVPNGTGSFTIQTPTFNASNAPVSTGEALGNASDFHIAPNPANTIAYVRIQELNGQPLIITDIQGRVMLQSAQPTLLFPVPVSSWPVGVYLVKYGASVKKLIISK